MRKYLRIFVAAMVGVLLLLAYYKIAIWQEYQQFQPEVEPQIQEIQTDVVAFQTPQNSIAKGDYELEITYQCDQTQQIEFIHESPGKDAESLAKLELPAEQDDLIIPFTVDDVYDGMLYRLGFHYNGVGHLEIDTVTITMNGVKQVSYVGADLQSLVVGGNAGKVDRIPVYYAKISFTGLPTTGDYVVKSAAIDTEQYCYQIVQTGDYDWNYVVYDSTIDQPDPNINFHTNQKDACTILLYRYTEATDVPAMYVDNLGLIYAIKHAIMGMAILLLVASVIFWILSSTGKHVLANKLVQICKWGTVAMALILYCLEKDAGWVSIFLLLAIDFVFLEIAVKGIYVSEICEDATIIKNSILGAMGVAVLTGVIVFRQMLTSKPGSLLYYFNSENKMNLKDYVLIVGGILLLFLILLFVFQKCKPRSFGYRYSIGREVVTIGVLLFALGTKGHYTLIPGVARYVAILIVLAVMFVIETGCRSWKSWRWSKVCVGICYVLSCVIWFITCGVFNLFMGGMTGYNLHHAGAYTAPLYYIARGLPFAGGETDLYGHYALFFKLPMMVFGANNITIGICMGIIGVICAVCLLKVLHTLVTSDFLRCIGAVLLGLSTVGDCLYWQTTPHRYLFPFLILAYCCWINDMEWTRKKKLIGALICMLAVIWNTESGAVTCLAWLFYCVLTEVKGKDYNFGRSIVYCVRNAIWLLVEFVLGYGLVELYNLAASGWQWKRIMDVKSDTGVLTNADYMVEFHQTILSWDKSSWIWIMCFFVLLMLGAVGKAGLVNRSQLRSDDVVIGMCAVEGLGLFTFFMNRVAAGCGIVMPYIVLGIFLCIQRIQNPIIFSKEDGADGVTIVKKFGRIVVIFILCLYVLNIQGNVQNLFDYRIKANSFNCENLMSDLENLKRRVPRNTYIARPEAPYLYLLLDWDMPLDEESSNTEYILATDEYLDVYPVVCQIPIGNYTYTLYYNQEMK